MPEFEIKQVYFGLHAVYVDGVCIGVVIPSRDFSTYRSKMFFAYENSEFYYGESCEDAVKSYFDLTTIPAEKVVTSSGC